MWARVDKVTVQRGIFGNELADEAGKESIAHLNYIFFYRTSPHLVQITSQWH